MRINLFLSKSLGISRRKADDLILSGFVFLNNRPAVLGEFVNLKKDKVIFEGEELKIKNDKIFLLLNKPKGYLTTKNDPQKRKTVMDLIPDNLKYLKPVGRLDYDSEGLLLFTNSGEDIFKLTHPKFEKEKEYIIKLKYSVTDKFIKSFLKGIDFDEGLAIADKVDRVDEKTIKVVLHQGFNRQLRRMAEALENKVVSLKRIRMGSIKLGDLKEGQWKFIDICNL